MTRTIKQKVRKLQTKVLGNSLTLPTEHTNFGEPIDLFLNGSHKYVQQ